MFEQGGGRYLLLHLDVCASQRANSVFGRRSGVRGRSRHRENTVQGFSLSSVACACHTVCFVCAPCDLAPLQRALCGSRLS
jgi:hypothetical protein